MGNKNPIPTSRYPRPEKLDEWIAALRSGEWVQCRHRVSNTAKTAYCCLGVLCKLHGDEPAYTGKTWEANHIDKNLASRCIKWNDKARLSFPEIADKLEELFNGH